MKLSVCTISFRHQLISLGNIAQWAKCNRFDAIELWGVHAKNLGDFPEYDRDWLSSLGLSVSMVSDYLPLEGDPRAGIDTTSRLCCLTRNWGGKKLRTFSGNMSSAAISTEKRADWTKRLRDQCGVAQDHGLQLVIETHPNTLADTLPSTLQLIEEINHPALRINFDVIHVWEMGGDPIDVFRVLEPLIVHLHLKNISDRERLGVFAPGNVYAPAGSREGMTPLFQGAYDFKSFLNFIITHWPISWRDMDASLEWFGPEVISTLEKDSGEVAVFQSALGEQSRSEAENPAPLA